MTQQNPLPTDQVGEKAATASEVNSYVVEIDSVTSSDGVTIVPGDKVQLVEGGERDVYWVGIHKPSYLSLIGIYPALEKGAVCFWHITPFVKGGN